MNDETTTLAPPPRPFKATDKSLDNDPTLLVPFKPSVPVAGSRQSTEYVLKEDSDGGGDHIKEAGGNNLFAAQGSHAALASRYVMDDV